MEIARIEVREKYLYIGTAGTFNLEQLIASFATLSAAMKEAGVRRVLFDGTGIQGKIPLASLFEIGVKLTAHWGNTERLAVLSRPDQMQPDKFWQTVTRNRGMNTAVFLDMDEAVKWLGGRT